MSDRVEYATVIETDELAAILAAPNTVVFDARFALQDVAAGRQEYQQGHVPGSFYLHLDDDLSGPITEDSGRHPLPDPEQFVERLRDCGVNGDTQIVVYDGAPGAFAARVWWMVKWIGHERVAVLNGGLPAWIESGGALTKETPAVPRQGKLTGRVRNDMLIDSQSLSEAISGRSVRLVDARAAERFRGEVEPVDKVAGHVPGAVNVPFLDNVDERGRFRPAEELAARHTADSNTVHMCGSGVTACHNILAEALCGRPLPVLYGGSWSAWISDPARPIATGD